MDTREIPEKELVRIWNIVRNDRDGARALRKFKSHGFDLGGVPVGLNTWSGMAASIPLLPNRRARSHVLRKPSSVTSIIQFLSELSKMLVTPYVRFEAHDLKAGIIYIQNLEGVDLRRATEVADFLKRVTSVRWTITEHNPRQNAIASVRWQIRHSTGKARDRELMDLLDAVFRAAGTKETLGISWDSLKKSDTNERETRTAARRKLLKGSPILGRKV